MITTSRIPVPNKPKFPKLVIVGVLLSEFPYSILIKSPTSLIEIAMILLFSSVKSTPAVAPISVG